MSYKKVRKNGVSFLVDETNNIVAISFASYVTKNKYVTYAAEEKRKNILNYLQTHKDQKYFIKYGKKEIYLTPDGENFATVGNYALSTPKVTVPKVTVPKVSVEKLDRTEEQPEYILRAQKWTEDLASMSCHTDNPFSTSKCYPNPYDEKGGKRVFIDLYRKLNDVHEGYIVLGERGTLNAMQSKLIVHGSFAAMRKKYGNNIRIYVIATGFDDKAIEYVKLNLFNVECKTLLKLTEEMVLEARRYYEEADACYKLQDWGKRYKSLFACNSSKTETGTPHLEESSFFNDSSSSFSRDSLSNMSNVVAFSAKMA